MRGVVDTQQNTVIVPNVEGITLEVAAKMLRTVGLQPRFPVSLNTSAIVAQQHPHPGVELPVGGEVVLFADTPGTTSDVLGAGAQEQAPSASSRSGIPAEGVSAPGGSITITGSNTGQNAYAAPSQRNWQTSKALAYPASPPGGQATILYRPPQPAISQYFVAETKPRFYPAWYPKRFLTLVSPQSSASTPQSDSMKITVQPQMQPQVIDQAETQSSLTWYPKVSVSQENSQEPVSLSQPDKPQRVGVFAVSATPAVPVPSLLRLRQEDATAAIKKAGLTAGDILHVESSQVRAGIVLKQSPRARAIVPAETKVHLWITN